jgi:hypothetical protein
MERRARGITIFHFYSILLFLHFSRDMHQTTIPQHFPTQRLGKNYYRASPIIELGVLEGQFFEEGCMGPSLASAIFLKILEKHRFSRSFWILEK